jgi:amino acid transporter
MTGLRGTQQVVKFTRNSVLFQALGTIFGAAMFLLFGTALGNVGLLSMLLIIVLGHVVTGAVAYTTSELASNKRLGSGGEYAMAKATHGAHISAGIGMSLFVAQTISITFYAVALAIGLEPVIQWFAGHLGYIVTDLRYVSFVLIVLVLVLNMLGGDITVRFLVPIVAIIGVSLLAFFVGVYVDNGFTLPLGSLDFTARIPDGMPFWAAFALVFPAFTGNTMGIGLSGELANPQREIPWGTKLATLLSFLVYTLIAFFLAMAATPEQLVSDRLIMARIATWPPLISIGLVVGSLSSLIGSMLVAPRTLQAMGQDGIIPGGPVLGLLVGRKREPLPALLLSTAIAGWLVFVADLEVIAAFVTMFFLITYMADCSASLLENLSNNPSYRPAQRAPWWLSLAGLLMALIAAVNIDATIFAIAMVFLVATVAFARWRLPSAATDTIFTSILFRIERGAALLLRSTRMSRKNWQPTVLAIGTNPLDKRPLTKLLDWIGARHGLVNLCQVIPVDGDFLSALELRRKALGDMDEYISKRKSHLIPDVIVTQNISSSILDKVQSGGYHANTIAFATEAGQSDDIAALTPIYRDMLLVNKNFLFLRYGHRLYGNRRNIYIWWSKPDNGQLMVILSYILLCQKDWKDGHVTICYIADADDAEEKERYLADMIEQSRFRMGSLLYRRFPFDPDKGIYRIIGENSGEADLVFLGLPENVDLVEYLGRWEPLTVDALFVRSNGDADLSA